MCRRAEGAAAAVVLAAGEARRFGGPKLAMPFGDSTVLGCVIGALKGAALDPIIVVVGANRSEIESALAGAALRQAQGRPPQARSHPVYPERSRGEQGRGAAVRIVENPDPGRGMLSSVQVGVAALPNDVGRFVIALADQPRLRAQDIGRLTEEMGRSGKGIARPVHAGKRGHPVVFAGRYREAILSLGPEATLRDVIHRHLDDAAEVEFDSDAFVSDVDTQEQYQDERRKADAER